MGDMETQDIEGEDTPYQPSDIFPNEEIRQVCLDYICGEIIDVRDGDSRKELESRWEKWRRQRRSVPESKTRDTPWINAANIEPPLTQQKVNTIWAKETAAFLEKRPRCTVEPLGQGPNETATAKALQKFLERLLKDKYGLDWDRKLPMVLYDQVSMGTDFVKVPFLLEEWSFKKTNDQGQVEDSTFVRHQGPALLKIRLEDFFTRPHWKDIDSAPWVAVRYRLFAHELKQRAARGEFDPDYVDIVLGNPATTLDDNKAAELNRSGVNVSATSTNEYNSEFEIFEVNLYWDIDGTGTPVDIVLFLHPDTRTILRSEFNKMSMRDIQPIVYFENPDSLYGIGVAEMCESMQDEVTTLHRMRLDGTSLAMQKNFFARRGCGIGPNDTIEPQKIWQVDDPQADIKVVEFPDIAPSCLTGEIVAKDYADRVSGASDGMSGFADQTMKSGATASGTIFLANQANSILSAVLGHAQDAATQIIIKALYQCIANKALVDLSWMDADEVVLINKVFDLGVEGLPTRFRFSVEVTDLMKTDEARRQNYLAVNQVYTQYAQQMIQIASLMLNPQLGNVGFMQDLLRSLYVGFTKFMAKTIDFFDVGISGDFLPFTDDMEFAQMVQDSAKKQQLSAVKGQMNGGQIAENQGALPANGGSGIGPAPDATGGGSPAPVVGGGGGGDGSQGAPQIGEGF